MLEAHLSTWGQGRGYPWQPCEQEPPLQTVANWHCHTEPDQWKNTHLTPILNKKVWRGGEGRVETQITAPLQIDLRRSAWICEDSLEQMLNDPLWSARSHKDLLQEQQLMCKGSYKPQLVIRYDQQIQTICKHASEEPCQRRGGAKPLRPPGIKSQALWGLSADPTKHNLQLALARS